MANEEDDPVVQEVTAAPGLQAGAGFLPPILMPERDPLSPVPAWLAPSLPQVSAGIAFCTLLSSPWPRPCLALTWPQHLALDLSLFLLEWKLGENRVLRFL